MDFEFTKTATHPITAGLVGALIGLKFAPGLSWFERAANVAAGGVLTYFTVPAVGEFFHLDSVKMLGFIAFMLGMFGMSLAAALFQGIRDLKVAAIITSWIKRNRK